MCCEGIMLLVGKNGVVVVLVGSVVLFQWEAWCYCSGKHGVIVVGSMALL